MARAVATVHDESTNPLAIEDYRRLEWQADLLQERLSELELREDEAGWQPLGFADSECDFTREYLRTLCRQARLYYLKNPLIKRAVDLQAAYVFGQGIKVKSKNAALNKKIQEFWNDSGNRRELTSHQALLQKEADLQCFGNIFFVFFSDKMQGNVRVRSIPVNEIAEIVTNPEDKREAWLYKRVWSVRIDDGSGIARYETRTAYYPDWEYEPADMPRNRGDYPINWESPVYHVSAGGLGDMQFGVPEVYCAIDWAKAYKVFLDDWAKLVHALSRFAWKYTTKRGKQGIRSLKAKIDATKSQVDSEGALIRRSERSPETGSVWMAQDGEDMTPMPKTGATVAAEDGRRLLLMVCAATGWPETFFGDVSVGTLATAKSLDRPTELRLGNRQSLWHDVLTAIVKYALRQSATALKAPLGDAVGIEDEGAIQALFPPILQHDVQEVINAIVDAATLAGKTDAGIFNDEFIRDLFLAVLKTITDIEIDPKKAAPVAQDQITGGQNNNPPNPPANNGNPGNQPPGNTNPPNNAPPKPINAQEARRKKNADKLAIERAKAWAREKLSDDSKAADLLDATVKAR